MSQKRFLDYGTPADASKTKVMHHQMFAAQILRVDEPFFSALAPDQLLINPHAVLFDSGMMLTEDEVQYKTIATTYNSASYTIYYEHEDENIIGGVAANLSVTGGLKTSLPNSVILGWVVYPGGSVPLDNTMLYVNWHGQVISGQNFNEMVLAATDAAMVPISQSIHMTCQDNAVLQTVIGGTQQVDFSSKFLSKNYAEVNQKIRVFDETTSTELTRVSGVPALNEFNLNNSGIVSFNIGQVGRTVRIADITYGAQARIRVNGSATVTGYVDTSITFPTKDIPIRTIFFEYMILDGYTVAPVEILDVNGDAASFAISRSEPTDGRVARMTVRLTGGSFQGVHGEAFTIRMRAIVQPSGMGADLRCRASVYDLPV